MLQLVQDVFSYGPAYQKEIMALQAMASFARLDKLKHVPQCAARKLTAINGMSALRHEIVAACKEYRG
jgi:hypothetical protein